MSPPVKKAHNQTLEETQQDIITHIPEIIKEKILSYLPLKKAVRTSILSKAWRSTWTTIPNLDFPRLRKKSRKELVKMVDSVLSQHKGTINKFELRRLAFYNDIDRWMLHLSRNGIKDLVIFMGNYNVPLSFFSCHTLNRVHLYWGMLELPQGFEGFKFLNTLEMTDVAIWDEDFEKLVSSSPKLENLKFHNEWDADGPLETVDAPEYLIINGPNLKKIRVCTIFSHIEINAPKVVVFDFMELIEPPIRNDDGKNNFTRVFGCVPQIEILRLGTNFLTYLSHSHAAVSALKSGPEFHKLKEIQFFELNFYNPGIAVIILYLLEKSPNLEVLDIMFHIPEFIPDYPVNYWRSLNLQKYLFGRLKLVTINMFEFEEMDITLSFLKMILLCSPNLEKLHLIKGNVIHEESDEKWYLSELLNLTKANENAQVVYEKEED